MVLGASMYESYFGQDTDIFDETAGIKPADYSDCESIAEACFRAMEEDALNWANFDKALALNELNYLRENGEEIVYEAVDVKGIIGKGVAIVKGWYSKMMGALQKFMATVSSKLASATKWLGINKKKLVDGMKWPEGKEFEDANYKAGAEKIAKFNFLYTSSNPFADLDTSAAIGSTAEKAGKTLRNYTNVWAGKTDGDGAVTVNDIKKNVLGDKIKINGSYMTSSKAAEIITGFKEGIAAVNESKKAAKQVANNMIKSIKGLSKSLKSDAGKDKTEKNNIATNTHSALKIVSQINSANSTLLTAKLIVMTGYLHQAQKIARIYLGQASAAEKDAKKAQKQYDKNAKAAAKEVNKKKKAGDFNSPAVRGESVLDDVLDFELV